MRAIVLVGLALALTLAGCARGGPSGALPYHIGKPDSSGTPVVVRNTTWRDLKTVTLACEWRAADGKTVGVSETMWIKAPWYASRTAHFPPPAAGATLASCKTSYTR
jgi:hypothetical protein